MDTAVGNLDGARPADAEALTAARADFWRRWRGELLSYAETRRQEARTGEGAPSAVPSVGDLYHIFPKQRLA